MSDTEQKTPNKTGASGAAWSDNEKIAYLIVLCENEGKVEPKIGNAPIPAGRSIVSCKKLLWRLKEKHKDDIEKIKNGEALGGDGEAADKPKTPKKRKGKAETAEGEDAEGSPKKKATPRKKKDAVEGEKGDEGEATGSPKKKVTPRKKKADAVKEENVEDEDMV